MVLPFTYVLKAIQYLVCVSFHPCSLILSSRQDVFHKGGPLSSQVVVPVILSYFLFSALLAYPRGGSSQSTSFESSTCLDILIVTLYSRYLSKTDWCMSWNYLNLGYELQCTPNFWLYLFRYWLFHSLVYFSQKMKLVIIWLHSGFLRFELSLSLNMNPCN